MTATEWFSGLNKVQEKLSLRPDDMLLLSEAPPPPIQRKNQEESNDNLQYEGDVRLQSSLALFDFAKEKQEAVSNLHQSSENLTTFFFAYVASSKNIKQG